MKYAFWIDGVKGPELQVLYESKIITEHDRLHAVAPPTPIHVMHEDLSLEDLKELYPAPAFSPISKGKRQD
jgi:hypothetical protein